MTQEQSYFLVVEEVDVENLVRNVARFVSKIVSPSRQAVGCCTEYPDCSPCQERLAEITW